MILYSRGQAFINLLFHRAYSLFSLLTYLVTDILVHADISEQTHYSCFMFPTL